jgi:hypothetical protein
MVAFVLLIALIPVYQIIVEDMAAGYELVPAEVM